MAPVISDLELRCEIRNLVMHQFPELKDFAIHIIRHSKTSRDKGHEETVCAYVHLEFLSLPMLTIHSPTMDTCAEVLQWAKDMIWIESPDIMRGTPAAEKAAA